MIRPMTRLARHLRRPAVLLAVLYLAGAALLAWLLPYQPAMVLPRADGRQFLIGFSPDGQRLAVGPCVSHHSLGGSDGLWLPDDPFPIWDLTPGRQPSRVAVPTDIEPQVLVALAVSPSSRPFVWPYLDDADWRRRLVPLN